MPSKPNNFKSPYATSFKSAVKRGTPARKAVETIAKRCQTSPGTIINSLHKAKVIHRQKLNGQWVYWPCENVKTSATNAKGSQIELWQHLIDWCILSGQCKPQMLANNCGSQQEFMSYCRKFFNRQFNGAAKSTSRGSTRKSGTTTASRKRSSKVASRGPRSRKSSPSRRRTQSVSYKFPRTGGIRRYRKAA